MNKLKIDTTLLKDGTFKVSLSFTQTSSIPNEVFLHNINPDGSLGGFVAVAVKNELSTRQVWEEGMSTNTYGSGFARYGSAEKVFKTKAQADAWSTQMISDISALSLSMSTPETQTEVVNIE